MKLVKRIDGRMLRKACVRLSLATFSSMELFLKMDIYELSETIDELREANKKK